MAKKLLSKEDLYDPKYDTVPKLFASRVEKWKNRVAFRKKELGIWADTTWETYGKEVKIAGMALQALGLKKGQKISILSEPREEWLYCDLGCACIGGVTVGIYTTNAPDEVEYIVGHSDSQIFFAEDEEQLDKVLVVREKLPELKKIIVYEMEGLRDFKDPMVMSYAEFRKLGMKEIEKNPGLFEKLGAEVKPEDTLFIVYTSGTTGRPKGAMLSHHNIIYATSMGAETAFVYGNEEALTFLPLCHVAERVGAVFNQLMMGQTLNFAENLETVPIDLREVQPTNFFAVPRFWEKFYSSIYMTINEATAIEKKVFHWAVKIGHKTSSLRLAHKSIPLYLLFLNAIADFAVFRNTRAMVGLGRGYNMVSGGAPIAPEILAFFHAVGLRIKEVYGQTEDSGPTSTHHRDNIKLGTVGQPFPGVTVKIAADGEILVKGDNVFQGYLKEPELTKEYLTEDGWLHSGDLGEFDEDGFLKITGRKKDIIITAGGKNITPQYIENKLKASIYINDAVIIGDRKAYLTALIMIDKENVTDFAQKQRIPFTTFKSLCHQKEVIDLIGEDVRRVNEQLARVENIRKFRLIDVELQAEDPELTATMKLKRGYVNEKFKDLIKEMY
ncbi:MAG: long-chain fatty acid--CoA ligase [Deltaproteobacteria bacterium HGW-Deltaproteobacteria-12]|nr:MAG: long-chain fatty acid--CoA ligase [Deltaproteobacteria bacterium HGW-Deltaproteobacteria-12]